MSVHAMQSVACFLVRSREFFNVGALDAILPGSDFTDDVLVMLDATRDAFERGFVPDDAVGNGDVAFRALCEAAPTAAEVLPHLDALTAVHAAECVAYGNLWSSRNAMFYIDRLRDSVRNAHPGERFLFVPDSAGPVTLAARFGFRREGYRNPKHVSVTLIRGNSSTYGRVLGERMMGRDGKGVPFRRVRVLLDDGSVAKWRVSTAETLFVVSDAATWKKARARKGVAPPRDPGSWTTKITTIHLAAGAVDRLVFYKGHSVGPSGVTGEYQVTFSAPIFHGGP